MKKKTFALSCVFVFCTAVLQAQGFREPDKSPMDMAYYPDNFAHDRKGADLPLARVTYSRPGKNNREIFGNLVPYDHVWRTGANEATEIKLYQDATILGKKVKAGTYSLFTIPGKKAWIIILNKDLDYWGAYSYKQQSDVLRVAVPVKKSDAVIEYFSIQFAKSTEGQALLRIGWDNSIAELPIIF